MSADSCDIELRTRVRELVRRKDWAALDQIIQQMWREYKDAEQKETGQGPGPKTAPEAEI